MTAYWRDPNLWHSHSKLISKVKKVVADMPNMHVRPEDGRVGVKGQQIPLDAPWIFAEMDPCRHCSLWNHVYFQQFGIIPSKCRFACWKVVTKPSTIVDLFTLLDLLKEHRFNGKCGLDIRDYTPDPYAGFLYADSLKQGQDLLQHWQSLLEQEIWIGGKPDSFLKRGWTEVEQHKPSDQWDTVSDSELELENALDEIFVKEENVAASPQWLEQVRKKEWIQHAIRIGDLTWKQLVDDPMKWIPWTVRYDDEETFQQTMSPGGSRRALNNL